MEIYKLTDSQKPDEHVDIRVDGLMLKVRRTAETYAVSWFEAWTVFSWIHAFFKKKYYYFSTSS